MRSNVTRFCLVALWGFHKKQTVSKTVSICWDNCFKLLCFMKNSCYRIIKYNLWFLFYSLIRKTTTAKKLESN